MKKLSELNKKILTIKGNEMEDKATVGEVISIMLYNYKAENGKDALRISTKLIPMITKGDNSKEFEDNDYDLIKKAVEANQSEYPSGILGQLLSIFENESDVKEKV